MGDGVAVCVLPTVGVEVGVAVGVVVGVLVGAGVKVEVAVRVAVGVGVAAATETAETVAISENTARPAMASARTRRVSARSPRNLGTNTPPQTLES